LGRSLVLGAIRTLGVNTILNAELAQPLQCLVWLAIDGLSHADHVKVFHFVLFIDGNRREKSLVLLLLLHDQQLLCRLRMDLCLPLFDGCLNAVFQFFGLLLCQV